MILGRRTGPILTISATASLLAAGCTSEPAPRAARAQPPALAITPVPNAANVPLSTEIGLSVRNGKVTVVAVADEKGKQVTGALRADGTSWVPNRPLSPKRRYVATVSATNGTGETVRRSTRFTTMDKPTNRVQSTLYFEGGRTYGASMPVTLSFDPGVPVEARAAVQRRLFVTTNPPQPGAWHWLDNGTQVYYRAPDPWRNGTRISVRAALDGVPMGKAGYGDADRTASASTGPDVRLEIDNATKQMSVYRDGRLTRTIPVSMGKPSTPTSSGTMVIMEKHDSTVFDTRGEPNGGYVVTVANAMRLTWGGEFIHAAPWSVSDQGYRNVSHGCTNVSDEAAQWLMGIARVGDRVTIRGTEVTLDPGNGWTAWNLGWDEYVKGSALPVPKDLKPRPSPKPRTAAPSADPTATPGAGVPRQPAGGESGGPRDGQPAAGQPAETGRPASSGRAG